MIYNKNYTSVILEGIDRENPSSFYTIIKMYSERFTFGALKILRIKSSDDNAVNLLLTLEEIPLTARDYEEYMNEVMAELLNALSFSLDITFKYDRYQHIYNIEQQYRNIATRKAEDVDEVIRFIIGGAELCKYHVDALLHIFGFTHEEIGSMIMTFDEANGIEEYDEDEADEFEEVIGDLYFEVPRTINKENKKLVIDKLEQLGIKYEIKNY